MSYDDDKLKEMITEIIDKHMHSIHININHQNLENERKDVLFTSWLLVISSLSIYSASYVLFKNILI